MAAQGFLGFYTMATYGSFIIELYFSLQQLNDFWLEIMTRWKIMVWNKIHSISLLTRIYVFNLVLLK